MKEQPKIKRFHLFEFEDLSWFPDIIRSGGTDYLRYFLIWSELYRPLIPVIRHALEQSGTTKIVDLCSGGGGYIEQIAEGINNPEENKYKITLTDKFPNTKAYRLISANSAGRIGFCETPVDVFKVPAELKGFRVMFSAIHHFRPQEVKAILQNAVDCRAPIGLFDGGEKGLIPILGMLIFHPVAFVLCTPFFKPFKLSRIFFTYLLPLIPLFTIWDGVVSVLRMYRPSDLRSLADSLESDYTWMEGKTRNRFGVRATYLIGYPKNL